MYYNARYYDPALGTFVSPDTLVPDPGMVIDYNRFLYVRGNPLGYTDPSGHDSYDYRWVQEFMEVHGRPPNESDRANIRNPPIVPGSGPGNSFTTDDWGLYSEAKVAMEEPFATQNVISQAETESRFGRQSWQSVLKNLGANILFGLTPPGGNGFGVTGSAGLAIEVTGEAGVYFEKSGESYIGFGLGIGGSTGANADIGLFYRVFPRASSVRELKGWSVNVGMSGVVPWPAGAAAGGELNVLGDQGTGSATLGVTAIAGAAAKSNIPFPNVEFYANTTHTWLTLQFNFYDLLALPRPDQ